MNLTQPHKVLSVGFADPVHQAQHAFKQALDALSRPGKTYTLGQQIEGLKLGPAMAQLLLALSDDDTPVWWQNHAAGQADWLRFHTGAAGTEQVLAASFAVITDCALTPLLGSFASGSSAFPEQSCTLLIEVPSLSTGAAIELRGPGIETSQRLAIAGLSADFWVQRQRQQAAFPEGVDIIFTCAAELIGLPRSSRLERLEEI